MSTSTTHQAPSRLLIGLPEGTPETKYIDMEHLQSVIESRAKECDASDDYPSLFLLVTDLPTTILEEIDAISDFKKHISIDQEAKLLLVEIMVKKPHENMKGEFSFLFQTKIQAMGLLPNLRGLESSRVTNGSFVKEPDLSWEPRTGRHDGGRKWPTIVVEIGLSESESKLAIDAQTWLETRDSQVRIAITINIDQRSPHITFQRWEHTRQLRAIRDTTRDSRLMASVTQSVDIFHSVFTTDISGNFTIPFEAVFDRPPNGQLEGDIVFTRAELQDLAEKIWELQGFM